MGSRTTALLAFTAAGVLASCGSGNEVDLDAAQTWAHSTPPALAMTHRTVTGTTTVPNTAEADAQADDEEDNPADTTFDLDEPGRISRFAVACYGGGTIAFGYTVVNAEGNSSDSGGDEVDCDEAVHTVPVESSVIDTSTVSGVTVHATTEGGETAMVFAGGYD